MNPNYVAIVKQDLNKLLSVGFMPQWRKLVCYGTKKEWKTSNLCGFLTIQFCNRKEVLDEVIGHEVCSFLDGFFGHHYIMIALKDKYKITFIIDWGTFVWVVMPFGFKNVPTYQRVVSTTFKDYLGIFMKLFPNYFNVFNDLNTHLTKL